MRYKVLCGYIRQRWDCGDTVEIEEKHTGKYGARGQTREKKRKATPEEIKKHNQWKRERDVRRLIKWNFRERDYWITLTYPKDYRPTWEEMKDHAGKLVRKMREKYKKQGWTLKYIYRLAIGSRGGRHIHILINRESNEKTATDLIITDLWEQQWGHGHVNFRTTYSEGGYKQLGLLTANMEVTMDRVRPQQNRLKKALQQVADQYDFCVVDNAPDINISVINALTAANDVLIPVEVDDNTLEGMNELLDQIQEVKEELNPDLQNVRCFVSKYQKGNQAHIQGAEIIREQYPAMDTTIRFSGVVARSTFMRMPVALHSSRSAAAEDYEALVTEYLNMIGGVQDGEI